MAAAAAQPWLAMLLLLGTIWGLSFLFIKVAEIDLHPLVLTVVRLALGTGVLLAVVVARREVPPRDPRVWAKLLVAALLLNAVPFSLFALAEINVTSVLAGLCNSTTPLFTLPVAFLMLPGERPTRRAVVGLVAGFVGVATLLNAWHLPQGDQLLGTLACLGAAAMYGVGFPYTRRFLAGLPHSSAMLSTVQLGLATIALGVAAPFLGATAPRSLELLPVLSAAALGVFGTGIAYLLNYSIVRRAGATNASTVTYLIPVVATIAGVALLHEPLAWNQPVGGGLVLLSVAITQGRLRRPRVR